MSIGMDDLLYGLSLASPLVGAGLRISSTLASHRSSIRDHEYRSLLAEENALRADVLYLDREDQARREGIMDTGVFRMKAVLSGVSGASLDLLVGQNTRNAYKGINAARTARELTVARFAKEAGWHRANKEAVENNRWASVAAIAGPPMVESASSAGMKMFRRYNVKGKDAS
ncbi:MAG: hypothetical protein PUN43_04230 [Candidatus Liberibacter asiaticus]|nr:hypothetical protein [Candidatus Liberibacter asiaticus]